MSASAQAGSCRPSGRAGAGRAGGDRRRPGAWLRADEPVVRGQPAVVQAAVFYEIHIRGFFDGNGDGSGDFRGLTEKLDYLQWLGIDCIWLLPFYASPLRDGGYDIADFYAVHPDYGTVEDVKQLIDAAHARADPRDRRPGHEPHLVRPPVVPGVALEPGHPRSATGTCGRTRRSATRTRGSSSSTPRPRTGPGTRSAGPVLLAPLLLATSPTSTTTTPRSRRRCSTCCASGSTSASTASGSTPCPTCSSARARTARTCPRPTPTCKRVRARDRRPTTPTGCCSPRPTSGRRTSSSTSATATSATWRSTSR